jgi:hypothetical protein
VILAESIEIIHFNDFEDAQWEEGSDLEEVALENDYSFISIDRVLG